MGGETVTGEEASGNDGGDAKEEDEEEEEEEEEPVDAKETLENGIYPPIHS